MSELPANGPVGSTGGEEIRRFTRHAIDLSARVQPIASAAGGFAEVRFSANATGAGTSGLLVRAVDLGDGGVGLMSPVMLPRNAVLQLRVLAPAGAVTTSLLETRVVVRRCRMVDRSPSFLVGTAYVDRSNLLREKVRRAIAMLELCGELTRDGGEEKAGRKAC